MKLKRTVDIDELKELFTFGKVVPKRHLLFFEENDEEYLLYLNVFRSKIEEDNGRLYAPKGYSLSDVKQIFQNNKELNIADLKIKLGKNYESFTKGYYRPSLY